MVGDEPGGRSHGRRRSATVGERNVTVGERNVTVGEASVTVGGASVTVGGRSVAVGGWVSASGGGLSAKGGAGGVRAVVAGWAGSRARNERGGWKTARTPPAPPGPDHVTVGEHRVTVGGPGVGVGVGG